MADVGVDRADGLCDYCKRFTAMFVLNDDLPSRRRLACSQHLAWLVMSLGADGWDVYVEVLDD